MYWLKLLKVKLMLSVLCLTSLCFGENIKDNAYDNLLGAVEMGKFAKFKNLYLESKVTVGQKENLLAMANKIIEREKTNWPKPIIGKIHGFWGDISMVKGHEIKRKVRIIKSVFSLGLIGSFIGGCYCGIKFIANWMKNIRNHSSGLANLRNGNYQIPTSSNAAQISVDWQSQRSKWLFNTMGASIAGAVVGFSMGCLIGREAAKSRFVLASYRRFKGATKIKQLLETV